MSVLMDIAELRERASDTERPPTGDRPASATLTLGSDGAALPAVTELAALLPRMSVAGVRLAQSADFAALPAASIVRIIALIRECASIGVPVSWSLVLDPGQRDLIRRLDHLPAPDRTVVAGKEAVAASAWRSSEDFGLLYFRKGPNFLSVVDNRPESCRRIVLDDPATMDVFRQGLAGCPWAGLSRDPQYAAAAADLVEKGLLLRIGDHCVTLPLHMRTWPLGAALLGGTLASAGKKPEEGL
ncbi:DUF5825 family protein [Streptomyces sp. NPDC060031]|uniref:DUF5825 family protein n=1 Tax=Streptomyces sp. NPDC060031 TaxID=3347043 RepID=UPI0036818072